LSAVGDAMRAAKNAFAWLLAGFDRFFFQAANPGAVALFRIFFSATLLLNLAMRIPHTEFYYTDVGGMALEYAIQVLPEFHQPAFTWLPSGYGEALAMQLVQALALLGILFGVLGRIGSRFLALIALLTHVALMQRNISIVYGADIVSTFWLFGLTFMDSSEAISVRAYLRDRAARKSGIKPVWLEPVWSRSLTSVGLRLSQIQLSLIYGYTGFEKLKGGDWWDQTAIWKVLGNEQLMMADLSFLKSVPLIIGLATWGTVLFEVYAPVLLWVRASRRWVILAGWALHLGIAATMGLFVFSFTMMAGYLLFLESDEVRSLLKRFGGNKVARL
jgi:hypothetical protein